MATSTSTPSPMDLLSVKSRVSWGALAAGAMVALTIYMVLTLFGLALGIEVAMRGRADYLGTGAAIYSVFVLLVSFFFGGWTTSRLAVGESRLEAVLYGLILWGVLFLGMVWMVSAGIRTGFGAMVGVASGAYATTEGRVDIDQVARDLKRAGIEAGTVDKYRDYVDRVRSDPGAAVAVGREVSSDPAVRQTAADAAQNTRQAAWWTLLGVVVSVTTVILGALVGSGELLVPVPILGVRRPVRGAGAH